MKQLNKGETARNVTKIPRCSIDIHSARAAAEQLESILPLPSALELIALPGPRLPAVTLFGPPAWPSLLDSPTAWFDEFWGKDTTEFPHRWYPAYLRWYERVRRGQELLPCLERWEQAVGSEGALTDIAPEDPFVAGLLLLLLSPPPGSALRANLRTKVLADPFGSYMAAEGHTLPEERPPMLSVIQSNSRLLYWVSKIPGFGRTCSGLAAGHSDLWGVLTVAAQASSSELDALLMTLVTTQVVFGVSGRNGRASRARRRYSRTGSPCLRRVQI